MSPKVLETKREEKDGNVIMWRTLLDEILGRVRQQLVITRDAVVHRSWVAMHYSERSLRKMKTKDGKDAVDVVWGHEGEGRSDWYWTIIVPADPSQIERLFSSIKDFETFGEVFVRLHDGCLSKNVNKRAECDLSFLF